jgi:Mg2+ and Co2+ transporter CorA
MTCIYVLAADKTFLVQADQEVRCFKFFREQIKNREKQKVFNRDAVKSITDEIRLIYELKDIRDEIHLIRRVFDSQADVLQRFARLIWPGTSDAAKQSRHDYLEECGTRALITRTNRLDENARRTLEGVGCEPLHRPNPLILVSQLADTYSQLDYLVQVKQAQSSLDEAEASRSLNNYIMVFTVVTIIFVCLLCLGCTVCGEVQTLTRRPGNVDTALFHDQPFCNARQSVPA